MKVKVSYGSDIRIWRRDKDSFSALKIFVEQSFEQLKDDFLLTYDDDEGDRVTITDDIGLEEAFDVAKYLNLRSLRIKVELIKHAQRIEEPGAGDAPVLKGEENVSEPGVGVPLNHGVPRYYDNKEQEEDDDGALDVQLFSTPTDQLEGAPPKQTIQYWVSSLLPLLGEVGVQEELEGAIPTLIQTLDQGDNIETALQTMITQCELLQQQDIIQEFMRHTQMMVGPVSDEIVPAILTLGAPGLTKMISKLCTVSRKWRAGVSNLKFNVTPFLAAIWPSFIQKLQASNQMPCEINLADIPLCRAPSLRQKESSVRFEPSSLMSSGDEDMVKHDSKFRLEKVANGTEEEFEKPRSWHHSRGRRGHHRGFRGRWHGFKCRARGRSPRRDHGFWHSQTYGNQMHNSHHQQIPSESFTAFTATPYMPNPEEVGHHPNESYQKSFTAPWAAQHTTHNRHPPNQRFSQAFSGPSRFDNRKSNRLEQPQKDEIRISTTPLKAEFIDHVNIPLRSKYLPKQKLLKKWCVRNVGQDDWDNRVFLEFTKGSEDLPTKRRFPVPTCKSGHLCELSAMIKTLEKPGRYTAYFRLVREGTFFGPRIWVDVHVVGTEEELTHDDEQTQKRLERLETRASAQRASATRSSAKRVRTSARRSKTKKKDNSEAQGSSLGLVGFPVFDKKNSTLNKDAEAFVPLTSTELRSKKSKYDGKLEAIHNMGFHSGDDKLCSLLDKYEGDVARVVEDLCREKENKL